MTSEPRKAEAAEESESTSRSIWVEVLRISPQIGYLVLALVAFAFLVTPVRDALREKGVSKIGVFAMTIEFAHPELIEERDVRIPELEAVEARISRNVRLLADARILWVDEKFPEHNVNERWALSSLGTHIKLARTTKEAMAALAKEKYDLVISDLKRDLTDEVGGECFPGQPKADYFAGCKLAKEMADRFGNEAPPIIFYSKQRQVLKARVIGKYDLPTPVGAMAITNRVDELFHLILDVLERKKRTIWTL